MSRTFLPSVSPSRALTVTGRVGAWLLVLLIVAAASSASSARALVTDVSFTARSDGMGYVVRIHSTERIDAYSMPRRVGQHEIEWTLYDTGLDRSYRKKMPDGPVKRYTVTRHDGHLTLRLYLNPDQPVTVDAYRDGASDDLLMNLAYENPPVASSQNASQSASSQPASSQPASSKSTSSRGGSSNGASAGSGGASSTPVRTVSGGSGEDDLKAARDRWRLDTVVIDAGHGGKDPGATGNGVIEKHVVLDVALLLGDYIKEKLGVNVVYTRTDDSFVELEERGHIANRAGAKLFISIHANAAGARSAHGTETFFLGPHKSESARRVMERENSVIKYEDDPNDYADFSEAAVVRQTLAQSAYMRQSERLAGLIEGQFADRVNRRSRGVHQAGFIVLWGASMPAVLVELGFLSNPREARFLSSKRGKVYMASALFRAVRDYKQFYEKGIETVATE